MGAESKLKAAGGSGKENTRPRRVPQRQVEPPTPETSPPPGAWFASLFQCRPGSAPGDARGEAPCIRKPKSPPSPSGKGGGGLSFPFGEGGQKSKLKAGAAGNKEGKPPRQIPGWLGEPTTPQRTVSATRSINRLRQSRARRSAMCAMASPVAEPCPFMTGLRTPSRRAPPCVL